MIRTTYAALSRRSLLAGGAALATTAFLPSRPRGANAASDVRLTAGTASVRLRDQPSPETAVWAYNGPAAGPHDAGDRLCRRGPGLCFRPAARSLGTALGAPRQTRAAVRPAAGEGTAAGPLDRGPQGRGGACQRIRLLVHGVPLGAPAVAAAQGEGGRSHSRHQLQGQAGRRRQSGSTISAIPIRAPAPTSMAA